MEQAFTAGFAGAASFAVVAGFAVVADLTGAADFTGAGFAITGLEAGLVGFTVTFDVRGNGVGLAGGRSTFFVAAAL